MAKPSKSYWLMKSEPDVYSIDDLKQDKVTMWDGVRNYQARNNMMEMKKGDEVLFYHSRSEKAVVGIMKVASDPYPDPTQFRKKSPYYDEKSSRQDPRWHLVDVRYQKKLKQPVTLARIRERKTLSDMVLVNNSRLSVQPVRKKEFEMVVKMGTPAKKASRGT